MSRKIATPGSRWLWIIGTAALCAIPAQSQDWSRLARLKHGTLIQVHSVGKPLGQDDRCRLEVVDAATLRCSWEGDDTTRLVFPANRVAVVYQVRGPGSGASTWIGLAALGGAIAEAAVQNIPAAVVFVVVAVCAWFKVLDHTAGSAGQPPQERLKVVYRR